MVTGITFVSEERSGRVITHEIAYSAVAEAFIAAARPQAAVFPAVVGHGSDPKNQFTVKSGTSEALAGVKIGTYFPSNDDRGLPRHGTSILLIDQKTGRIGAVVEAARVNAFRTAAANAVATDALARTESHRLAIFGTGHQALFEVLALVRVRPISRVLVVGRRESSAREFRASLVEHGLDIPIDLVSAERACAEADIIVTATLSSAPLFSSAAVRPGTHISCMGADTRGKQELPPELFERSTLFCDLPTQSVVIGEFQHAPESSELIAIGRVLDGEHSGRTSQSETTVFDSSGIALQDLYVASAILRRLDAVETESVSVV